MQPYSAVLAVGLAMAVATACGGKISDDGDGRGGTGMASPATMTGGRGGTAAVAAAAGVLPMRLLTRAEYDNTVLDLLGDDSHPAAAFPPEDAGSTGFAQVQKLDDVNIGAYLKAAETIAERASKDLKTLMGCDPAGAAELVCVKSFVTSFGRRAYRRPLRDAEVDEHVALYTDTLKGTLKLGINEAMPTLVAAMLQSPFFLYRWESAWEASRDGRELKLNAHHLASQLSYFFWSSMPDAELMAAADRGELQTTAQIQAQAVRLLADPRAERSISSFVEQWLGITALEGALRSKPGWGPTLARAMIAETDRFAADVILKGNGLLTTLFTSRLSSADATLAAFYGNKTITGTTPQPLTFAQGERAGILTLAATLAAHADENDASPILRGKLIRERVMCDAIPPPPGGVPDLPAPDPNTPKKQRFAMHAQGTCKGCHELMDPIGFAFEHYDNVGAYRTMDGKLPVDSSGAIKGLDGSDQSFTSAVDMMDLLGNSDQVRTCLMKQFFRFGFARKENEDADVASLKAASDAFRSSNGNIRKMLAALATSRVMTHRSLAAGEVLP
ncbi:MAG: DUF1592 domain-containing protein [Deltaproteobacteria bacterium]|nr:DUF1592 domain-containing protein [Deltaproteobacteria bacterium]